MIDKQWIGREIGRSVLPIEAGRLRFFAKAIGETDPIDHEEAAAISAGYAGLPAAPTFLFAAELDSGAAFRMLEDMRVPLGRILHGEQGFEYFGAVFAGDVVTVTSAVKDIYEKKGGTLEFIEIESEARNQAGALVARMRSLTVVRH
jgi:acyl dehydratase